MRQGAEVMRGTGCGLVLMAGSGMIGRRTGYGVRAKEELRRSGSALAQGDAAVSS